jgi:dTDP-4-amino-4,6-dideoxygalactose transaminase
VPVQTAANDIVLGSDLQFADLKAQFKKLPAGLEKRMSGVLTHGGFSMGLDIAELEREFAAYCGGPEAGSCANGTDALALTLRAAFSGWNGEFTRDSSQRGGNRSKWPD